MRWRDPGVELFFGLVMDQISPSRICQAKSPHIFILTMSK